MGMWSMWSAPLVMSNDLRDIGEDYVSVLTNAEVIAVDQDDLGASADGVLIVNNSNVMSAQVSVWNKPLSDGSRAVALLNLGLFDAATYNMTLTAELAGLPVGSHFMARDLWLHKELGTFAGTAQFLLQPTSITMLKLTAIKDR